MERDEYIQSRKFERFPADALRIDCEVCGKDRARLRDVSFGGAGIFIDQPPEVGTVCSLTVQTREGRFRITGKVVWSRSDIPAPSDPKGYPCSMGVSFERDSQESGKDLVYAIINSA